MAATEDDPLADAIRGHDHGTTVAIRVVPRAPRTQLAGRHGGRLKLKVSAPPVDGAANAAVLRFVADRCGVRPGDVELLQGARSRDKLVLVRDVSAAVVRDSLS